MWGISRTRGDARPTRNTSSKSSVISLRMTRSLRYVPHFFAFVVYATATLACLAVCCCPQGAQAQELSTSEVLNKVAERYGQVSSFSIVATKKVDLDMDTSGERIVHPNPNPNVVVAGSHSSEYIEVTLMVSGSSKAKLLLKDGRKEIVVVTDGEVVWTLLPTQHVYTELPAGSVNRFRIGNDDISGVDLLPEYQTLVAGRFELAGHASPAKLEHSEALKVGKDTKECYVLTIQTPGSRQKMWIDKTEFTVWKSVDRTVDPEDCWGDRLERIVTVTTKQMSLNPAAESNFVFTPPVRAKRVDSLRLSGNPF